MEKVSNLQVVFANNLKTRRKKAGLTQMALAEQIGVSTSFITEIETNRKAPSFQTIEKIAGALGVPAWTLFCEYSDNLRTNLSGSSDMIKLILKNKLSDAIEEVLG